MHEVFDDIWTLIWNDPISNPIIIIELRQVEFQRWDLAIAEQIWKWVTNFLLSLSRKVDALEVLDFDDIISLLSMRQQRSQR